MVNNKFIEGLLEFLPSINLPLIIVANLKVYFLQLAGCSSILIVFM